MKTFNKEQTDVLESKADRLLVSASAGSGKTTIMIEKILGLIREGNSLRNMLVSTFTKASAADIRTKLYDVLYKERASLHIKEQLDYLQLADITNLHSFCQRQISQYFYCLGIDPAFTVLDEPTAINMQNECLSEVIDENITKGDCEFLLLYEILMASRNDRAIREYVREIYRFAKMQPNPTEWLSLHARPPKPELLKKQIDDLILQKRRRILERVLELERLNNIAGFTRNQPYIDELIDYVRGNINTLTKPAGKIPDEFRQLHAAFTAIKKEASSFYQETEELLSLNCEETKDPKAEILSRMAIRLSELYSLAKMEKSVLDFSDLEHFMLQLLNNSEAANEIAEKYKYIFVDEYQDISPLQEEILSKISSNAKMFFVGDIKQSIYAFRGCEPSIFLNKYNSYQSEELNARHASNCDREQIVGENKQQIIHKQEVQPKSCEVIRLNANYRSEGRILEFCNDLFSRLMTKDFGGIDYAAHGMFVSARGEIGIPPQFFLVKGKADMPQDLLSVYSVLKHTGTARDNLAEAEQSLIVAKILELMNQSITKNGAKRNVDLSDIVILVRSGGDYVSTLKSRLERSGIAVSIDEKLNFLSEYTTAVLIEYLELINNFDNDIALLSVMRSAFGGFSDSELARIRSINIKAEYFYEAAREFACNASLGQVQNSHFASVNQKSDGELAKKIRAFFETLQQYYFLSLETSVDRLLGAIVSDTDYFKHVFSQSDGKSKAELLEGFLNFVSCCPYKKNITAFLRHLSDGLSIDKCPSVLGAVRIMTVHASKGLEFPFVLFANVSKGFNVRDASDRIILDKDYGICLKNWDEETHTAAKSAVWIVAKEKCKKTMLEEELRILYVALTRAEFGLFIFSRIDEESKLLKLFETGERLIDYTDADSFLTWLLLVMNKYVKTYHTNQIKVEAGNSVRLGMPLFSKPDKKLTEQIKTGIQFIYPHKAAIRKTFVTAAARLDSEADLSITTLFNDEETQPTDFDSKVNIYGENCLFCGEDTAKNIINSSTDNVSPQKAMKRGTAFHKAMEQIDFFGDFDSEWQKLDKSIVDLADYNLTKKAVSKIKEVIKEGKIYKELPFILNCPLYEIIVGETQEKVLIQGIIDLLILTDEGAIIIDYKSSKLDTCISQEYKKQVRIYAKAVEDILKIIVKKTYLYSFLSGELYEV